MKTYSVSTTGFALNHFGEIIFLAYNINDLIYTKKHEPERL